MHDTRTSEIFAAATSVVSSIRPRAVAVLFLLAALLWSAPAFCGQGHVAARAASAEGQLVEGKFSGSVLRPTPKSPGDNSPAYQTSDLIKKGISPFIGGVQFTAADGIVYSTVELDQVAGKVYLTSPGDKLWKVEVSGFEAGKLTFTRVALVAASAKLANGARGTAKSTITRAKGSSYVSSAIGYVGKSAKVTVVTVTLENGGDQPISLNWKSAVPVLRTTAKRLEATHILVLNWLPMAGGVAPNAAEMGCGGMEIEGVLQVDKGIWCGWLAIDKPGNQVGDHVSIPVNSATVTVTKGKPASIKLLFPGDIALPDAELILPQCKPSPFRLGPRMSPKTSR